MIELVLSLVNVKLALYKYRCRLAIKQKTENWLSVLSAKLSCVSTRSNFILCKKSRSIWNRVIRQLSNLQINPSCNSSAIETQKTRAFWLVGWFHHCNSWRVKNYILIRIFFITVLSSLSLEYRFPVVFYCDSTVVFNTNAYILVYP